MERSPKKSVKRASGANRLAMESVDESVESES